MYGVLRRLAPSLKHDMVVNLQAVAMMAEMLNARIERGSVNPADLQSNISKLNRLAREAQSHGGTRCATDQNDATSSR